MSLLDGQIPTQADFDAILARLTDLEGNNSNVWQSWTPTFTNCAVSNSALTAKYIEIGNTIMYRLSLEFAGGDKPSGTVSFTLPVEAHADYDPGFGTFRFGHCYFRNEGVSIMDGWNSFSADLLEAIPLPGITSSTYLQQTVMNASTPFTWGNTDGFTSVGAYERAV